MNDDLRTAYHLAQRTRAGVLDWLEALPPGLIAEEREDFAFGSLDAIYTHAAGCYLWWIGTVGFGADDRDLRPGGMRALRDAFAEVDALVARALATFTDLDEPFAWTSPEGHEEVLTRRWLILHPITHEFHHKGQALALARVLGHPFSGRPDADLVSP